MVCKSTDFRFSGNKARLYSELDKVGAVQIRTFAIG
jgi:dTDP-4-dehydrorhamnose reductase